MAKGSNGHGSSWLRRSYNFIDKDPECDVFRTLYQKEHIKETDLAVLAGLSVTTVKKMFGGDTRQPRHSTFAKMAGAMGYHYGLQRDEKPNYDAEIPKARDEFKAHKEALRKKREREARRSK
ncbi:transcriptional regulator with XRE-family HTH domain [Bradyrhizobium ottawaense]|uniref:helix-turn-helix domain-containing protein n=1 Tax=Bradyrhizobium ottawaense TaxID=931866 RepID=UPI0035114F43